jgi:hypothetical protein
VIVNLLQDIFHSDALIDTSFLAPTSSSLASDARRLEAVIIFPLKTPLGGEHRDLKCPNMYNARGVTFST